MFLRQWQEIQEVLRRLTAIPPGALTRLLDAGNHQLS